MDGAGKVAGSTGMSAPGAKANGKTQDWQGSKLRKKCRMTELIEPTTRNFEVSGHMPFAGSNCSDPPYFFVTFLTKI